jgi:hypothetical protein
MYDALSSLSLLWLYQSSGNGFQRRTFPFFRVPEFFSASSATITKFSEEDSLQTKSLYVIQEGNLFTTVSNTISRLWLLDTNRQEVPSRVQLLQAPLIQRLPTSGRCLRSYYSAVAGPMVPPLAVVA